MLPAAELRNSRNTSYLWTHLRARTRRPYATSVPTVPSAIPNSSAGGTRRQLDSVEDRAAQECGIECPMQEYEGDAPAAFVVSLNLHRRHLSESQRAMVAARLATLEKGANQHAQICAPSQDDAAEMLGVSRRSVQTAREVINEAPAPVVRAVEAGSVSVSLAALAGAYAVCTRRQTGDRARQTMQLAHRHSVRHATQGTGFYGVGFPGGSTSAPPGNARQFLVSAHAGVGDATGASVNR